MNSLHTVESPRCEDELVDVVVVVVVPSPFAHARYSSRMIDRFLN